VPKIDYRIKKTLKIDVEGNKNNNNNSDIENNNLYKKLTNNNLAYINNLRNMNNFQINKTMLNDDEFSFQRKEINQYNPMRDRREMISPPSYKNQKWSPFLENYFLIANTEKKFQRKGGLLTEFCNKNIISINNDKKLIQQKLKKQNSNIS